MYLLNVVIVHLPKDLKSAYMLMLWVWASCASCFFSPVKWG